MIPAWAIRLLPYVAAIAIVLGAIMWIDHRGYQRAKADAERRQLVDAIVAERKTRRIEQGLSEAADAIYGRIGTRIDAIQVLRQTIIQPIQQGIANDPRYRDRACDLTPGVFAAINQARAATNPAAASGSVTVALPAAASAE